MEEEEDEERVVNILPLPLRLPFAFPFLSCPACLYGW